MIIKKTAFPEQSILYRIGNSYGYADSYSAPFKDPDKRIGITDVGRAFFSSAPGWIGALFSFRNRLVSVAGLKTGGSPPANRQELLQNFTCEPGEQLGLFRVFSKSDTEIVLGEDDSHLDFRVSLLLENGIHAQDLKSLTITTTVEFNNRLGKLYFLPVKPFHQLIVPAMLKATIKQLEKPRVILL